MNSGEVKLLLRKRYPANSHSLMFEVADATGASASRRADAIVMGCWPSRGLDLQGFEIKVSRRDWQKELKTPQKAEAFFKYCDHWWLVSPEDVARPEELPPTWGHLVVTEKGLREAKKAPKLSPAPLDRVFLAALLRACVSPAVAQDATALRREYDRGYQTAAKSSEDHIARLTERLTQMATKISTFETAAGFRIEDFRYSAQIVGQTVRDVLAGKHNRDEDALEQLRAAAIDIVVRVNTYFEGRKNGNATTVQAEPVGPDASQRNGAEAGRIPRGDDQKPVGRTLRKASRSLRQEGAGGEGAAGAVSTDGEDGGTGRNEPDVGR